MKIDLLGNLNATEEGQDFTIYAGDDGEITYTISGDEAIAGATIAFTAKKKGTTAFTKTTASGITISGNEAEVAIDAADTTSLTGSYTYALVVTLSGEVYTASTGYMNVKTR